MPKKQKQPEPPPPAPLTISPAEVMSHLINSGMSFVFGRNDPDNPEFRKGREFTAVVTAGEQVHGTDPAEVLLTAIANGVAAQKKSAEKWRKWATNSEDQLKRIAESIPDLSAHAKPHDTKTCPACSEAPPIIKKLMQKVAELGATMSLTNGPAEEPEPKKGN